MHLGISLVVNNMQYRARACPSTSRSLVASHSVRYLVGRRARESKTIYIFERFEYPNLHIQSLQQRDNTFLQRYHGL
jgi:hypothetical protein